MNPYEVGHLICISNGSHLPDSLHMEAYLLLIELYLIAGCTMPQHCDQAMQHILDLQFIPDDNKLNIPLNTPIWSKTIVEWNYCPIVSRNINNPTQGVGIPPPDMHRMLEIDSMGEYLLMHGHPGQKHHVNRSVIDYQLRFHR